MRFHVASTERSAAFRKMSRVGSTTPDTSSTAPAVWRSCSAANSVFFEAEPGSAPVDAVPRCG
jgi:hypothetical protein